MRDIATATVSGNLTREVELRPLPSGTEVARLRVASGTRRRSGQEWVERTNYFTVEVYGPQANLCAERLGKGSRVVVDGELDWREWTDQEQKRREGVVLRKCFGSHSRAFFDDQGRGPGGGARRLSISPTIAHLTIASWVSGRRS